MVGWVVVEGQLVDSNCTKYPLYTSEILTDPYKGIYNITTQWSDGSMTVEIVTRGSSVIPPNPDWLGF